MAKVKPERKNGIPDHVSELNQDQAVQHWPQGMFKVVDKFEETFRKFQIAFKRSKTHRILWFFLETMAQTSGKLDFEHALALAAHQLS